MVDAFIAAGFTYFDTSFAYHNGHSEAAFRQAVAEPPRGVLRPLEVWQRLARACVPGLAPDAPLPGALGAVDDDEWCNAFLAPLGRLGEDFAGTTPCGWLRSRRGFAQWPASSRKYDREGFATPDGKIDLAPASLVRFYAGLDQGVDRLSGSAGTSAVADGDAPGGPFLLVTGRSPLHTHTATQDCYPEGSPARRLRLLVNAGDASRLGLVRDAWVRMRGARGASAACAAVGSMTCSGESSMVASNSSAS